MPRPCGPCGDNRRNELDRRLLEMEINGETFRRISQDFGYSEYALRRHLNKHLIIDLAAAKQSKELARQKAIEETQAAELEKAKSDAEAAVKDSMAARLDNAINYLDQLRELRTKAASLLDAAESSGDLKSAASFLRELREEIRLMGELEGKLAAQPQITIINHPEWVELRTVILTALDPFPQAKEAIVNAIRGR